MARVWGLLLLTGMVAGSWVVSAQEPPQVKEPSARGAKDGLPPPEVGGLRLSAGQRSANAESRSGGLGFTSTPLIDVTQPRSDLLLVTMTGVVAAGGVPCEDSFAEIAFDLSQVVNVIDERPGARTNPRPIKLTLEAQLIGLFRANRNGAGVSSITVPAEACVVAGTTPVLSAGFEGRTHTSKDMLLISERSPAVEALVTPGQFALTQRMTIRSSHPKKCFHKNVVTAAFGEPGRQPEWLGILDPSRDLPRGRDLGFRVAIRVEPVLLPPLIPAPNPVSPSDPPSR
jgi:hypothetical protein